MVILKKLTDCQQPLPIALKGARIALWYALHVLKFRCFSHENKLSELIELNVLLSQRTLWPGRATLSQYQSGRGDEFVGPLPGVSKSLQTQLRGRGCVPSNG
jgi:hypothetical protein